MFPVSYGFFFFFYLFYQLHNTKTKTVDLGVPQMLYFFGTFGVHNVLADESPPCPQGIKSSAYQALLMFQCHLLIIAPPWPMQLSWHVQNFCLFK